MPTETIQMDSVGAPSQWSAAGVGPPTKVSAIAAPDDDDSTYVESTGVGDVQRYIPAAAVDIQAGDLIHAIRIRHRGRSAGGLTGQYRAGLIVDDGSVFAPTRTGLDGTYTTWDELLPSRPGGGRWTVDDLGDLEVALVKDAGAGNRVTTLDLLVDYSDASTTPIIERIAAKIETALNTVTSILETGTSTITVVRPNRLHWNKYLGNHLTIVMEQGGDTRLDDIAGGGGPPQPATERIESFLLTMFVVPSDSSQTPLDQMINIFRADVYAALMADPQWKDGGVALAVESWVERSNLFTVDDGSFGGAELEYRVQYRTDLDNEYTRNGATP